MVGESVEWVDEISSSKFAREDDFEAEEKLVALSAKEKLAVLSIKENCEEELALWCVLMKIDVEEDFCIGLPREFLTLNTMRIK